MKSKWKRNAVVGAMVVLVCAAVGLNWKYSAPQTQETGLTGGTGAAGVSGLVVRDAAEPKILGEAALVNGEGLATDEDAVYAGDDYFASARLTRQQARDSAITLLQEAADQKDADQAAANEASEGIQVLASYTLKEAQIENLVTAKGYQDCVAFMGDGSVSVVVSNGQGELSGEDVAKITDIAMAETGFPASGVKILAAS